MKISKGIITFLCSVLSIFSLHAQESNNETIEHGGDYYRNLNPAQDQCLSPQQYAEIESRCNRNAKLFIHDKPLHKTASTVAMNWPLRAAAGFTDCGFYFISAHVDQDTNATVYEDYNCGTIAYDGHRGTDIAIFPFPFYKMDNNQVEVIAGADGTIVDKVDGNFDKNCASNSLTPNYVVIQHADGSRALYVHMKMNSLTSKIIGQTVTTGEFLGTVGSSGSSSGPHLHFEVWTGSTVSTRNDPFSGSCNALNAGTWWAAQKPYTEPAIVKAAVGHVAPVMPACPATETPNEDSCFQSGTSAVFAIYIRNETISTTVNMRIVNPNNTTYSSWTHNCTSNNLGSWWYWNKTLPATAGIYTFETTYNGIVCSKVFKINCSTIGIFDPDNEFKIVQVYPNPSNGIFNVSLENTHVQGINSEIEITNVMGQKVYATALSEKDNLLHLNLAGGFYFYQVLENKKLISTGKLIIQ